MKILGHGVKVMKKLFKKDCQIVTVNKMDFVFMPEKGTIDAMFFLRWLQEERCAEGKSSMCFVDLEKAFDKPP